MENLNVRDIIHMSIVVILLCPLVIIFLIFYIKLIIEIIRDILD